MIAPAPLDPRASYQDRQAAQATRRDAWWRRQESLGAGKIAAFVALLGVAVWALEAGSRIAPWIALPLVALIVLSRLHDHAIRARERAVRAEAFYRAGLDRLDHRWMGNGLGGEAYVPVTHPYARDLDIVGSGSLFELLCTARTEPGQTTLAAWLLAPAPPDEVAARQAAVVELRDDLDLRERLGVVPAADEDPARRPAALADWARQPAWTLAPWRRRGALVLAILWLATLALWIASGIVLPFFALCLANLAVWNATRGRFTAASEAAEWAARGAAPLAEVVRILEAERPRAPKLQSLRAGLALGRETASRRLGNLAHWVSLTAWRRDLVFRLLDPFLLWSRQWQWEVEAWRARWGPALGVVLEALGQYEALVALAGYWYEHPADTLPEFIAGPARFEAWEFAHPLLPPATAVPNDLALGPDLRLAVISGPNMAGKSTLLRAVGVNIVLAHCGAPVRARALRLTPLRAAASVCVLDSLQGGISRFYAELRRLKEIADLARGPWPVLFLLDELMQGTNAADRRHGAEAVTRDLLAHGALGLITTHDLALTELAEGLGAPAACFHFDDRLENGELRFDYRLSRGVSRSGNALLLMRALGLPV